MTGKITDEELHSSLKTTINNKAEKSAVDEIKLQLSKKLNDTDIVDDLNTADTGKVLSANQGKILNSTLTDVKTKTDDWNSFKTNGGTINGDLDLVKNDITTHLGYSSFAPVSSSWSVKGGVIETPVGINLAVQPGQWSAILPFVNGDISIGSQYYKFLDQYLSGDSFATRHVGGNNSQDKRYRISIDDDSNFAIQKIKNDGTWLYNILQENGNNSVTINMNDLYFGSFSKTTNGYNKLPNGLIIQWGYFLVTDVDNSAARYVNFPLQFPNKCFTVVGNVSAHDGNTNPRVLPYLLWNNGNTNFFYRTMKLGLPYESTISKIECSWMAIGY